MWVVPGVFELLLHRVKERQGLGMQGRPCAFPDSSRSFLQNVLSQMFVNNFSQIFFAV